jgi:nucleoside-diphosphate-sugar epimerase
MTGTVIVLGAKGRFGRAAVTAFAAAGWQVRAFARSWAGSHVPAEEEQLEGNASDIPTVTTACSNVDVIVNALNPPYAAWARDLPRLTKSVIAAAKAANATIMLPGNVYNYGEGMPETLTETTPHAARSGKGLLRTQMEQCYREAAQQGVRSIILRGGDFIEGSNTGNWFDDQIAVNVDKGRVMYPGPLDQVHAWAYLPDMARVLVALATRRSEFGAFEEFGFPGYSLTGGALIDALGRVSGCKLKVSRMNWTMLAVLGVALSSLREVVQMRYLWRVPHALDGTKLNRVLSEFEPTPLDAALQSSLNGLRTAT